MVTGATGSLGAHLVAKLAGNPMITRIYCLVRAKSDAEASIRLQDSLRHRCLHHTLPLASRRKITALAADLSEPTLGLSKETYSEVTRSLRSVIHSAWSVNFNMHLTSFEKSNIAGVSHLINLCSKVGPQTASFNFCSSVSTVSRCTANTVPDSLPDFEWAQGMGYAQSKSVAEHLCARATENGVRSRALRIGQIVG